MSHVIKQRTRRGDSFEEGKKGKKTGNITHTRTFYSENVYSSKLFHWLASVTEVISYLLCVFLCIKQEFGISKISSNAFILP